MQKASLILNKHDIPGTRYLGVERKGTHNFVIWDTDTLEMLGVDGNPEAEQHFREHEATKPQTSHEAEEFNQVTLGRQNSIRDVVDLMKTEHGKRNSGNVWADYARVSPKEAQRLSQATGLDINDRYVHTIVGSAITHTLNRHGEGNEQRQDQLPITDADFERIPYIIKNADEIRLGTDKTTGNLNDTIVYQKRINGHVLIVEEVRKGRKKLAFHTMRKAKAGYIYDLSLEGQPIVRENAKSEGVNVPNGLTPEVQLPNALSKGSLHSDNSSVNENTDEQYHQIISREGARRLDKAGHTTMRLDDLKIARDMCRAGKSPSAISLYTGWEADPNGDWQYELLDGELKDNLVLKAADDPFSDEPNPMASASLGNILDAPELFTAYPELKNVIVQFYQGSDHFYNGDYYPSGASYGGAIDLTGNFAYDGVHLYPASNKNTIISLLHEVQHEIQRIEGFEGGYSPRTFYMDRMNELQAQLNALEETRDENGVLPGGKEAEDEYARLEDELNKVMDILADEDALYQDKTARKHYLQSRGEIQARNVMHRYSLSPLERRTTLLSETEDDDAEHLERYNLDSEVYHQIGSRRKKEMDALLTKRRTDLNSEQRADVISEIEKLGEAYPRGRDNNNSKLENAALQWFIAGKIRLPEDGYTVVNALKLCEQHGLNYQQIDDPNEILVKYTHEDKDANTRIDPNTVPEFSSTTAYDNGIAVYSVEDRGEDANPWCLAARQDDDDNDLGQAWGYWSNNYSTIPKRIAFKNGKLLAFCASDSDEITWWNREDKPSRGIPYPVRVHDSTAEYAFDEETGETRKMRETLKDGTKREWFDNGQIASEKLPDGTMREWHEDGEPSYEKLPDGTLRTWYENGSPKSECLSDGTERSYYENGRLSYERLPDGTKRSWYASELDEKEKPKSERLPDRTEREWYVNGTLKSEVLPDGTSIQWYENREPKLLTLPEGTSYSWHENGLFNSKRQQINVNLLKGVTSREWYENGQRKSEIFEDKLNVTLLEWHENGQLKKIHLSDNTIREWYETGQIKSETLSDWTKRTWYENGQIRYENIFDGPERAWYENGQVRYEELSDGTRREWDVNGIEQSTGEKYHQAINATEAKKLDKAEGVTFRMDGLHKAKSMAREGSDAGAIRSATGWEKEQGGKWMYGREPATPEQQIAAVRKMYKNTPQWLKAPNGAKTSLSERQWLTVRTPAFKVWFGDWEHDPENASQALDENGEPLVLYHRTRRGQNFSIFEIGSQGAHFGTRKQADSRASGRLYSIFLNVRNPMRTTDQAANWNWEVTRAKRTGHDGLVYLNEIEGLEPGDTPQDSWAVFRPEQIKSADKNNSNFDPTDPDIYHQIIGKKGAERINNGSLDTLALAEQMEKDGIPAFAVWRITGWNRGKDGQWRTEIMDGQLRSDFVSNPKRRTIELQDAYDNPALYDAYPELLHMPLRVQKLGDDSAAYYDTERKSITINQTALQDKNSSEVKTDLIHEIQHAIQDIEGFDNGGGLTRTFYKWSNKLLAIRYDAWRFLSKEAHRKFADACSAMANGDNAKMEEAAASMPEEAQNIWAEAVHAYNRMQTAWKRYASISGEVEARNAETRSSWDEQKRRSTPLFASEDYKRSEQTRNFVSEHDIDQFNQLSRLPTNAEFVNGALPTGKLLNRGDKGYGIYLKRDLNPALSPLRLRAALPDGRTFKRNASGAWTYSGGNLDSAQSQILDDIVQGIESTLQENGYRLLPSQSFSDLWEDVIDNALWWYKLDDPDGDARFFGLTEEEKDSQRKEYQAKITFIQDLGHASVSSQDLAELTSNNYLTGSPDDNELLDWNSDMKHQPDRVQDILRRAFRNFDCLSMTGEQLYRWLAQKLGNDKNASLWLHKMGIPGLRYSEGSRSGFVVWDTRKLQLRDIFSFSDEKAIDSFTEARLPPKGQSSSLSAEDIEHAVPKEQVAFVRRQYEGTDKWMKAPNSKPTKLTKIQWLLVRTPAFKAWFGDWENDPQNASKILDENGEPRIVYRGSHIGDSLSNGRLSRSFMGGRATLGNHQGQGIWAHSEREGAATYGENVYPVFLNIRAPYILDAHGRVYSILRTPKGIQRTRSVVNDVFNGEYGSHDGVVFVNIIDIMGNDNILGDVFVAFERSQLKSAVKNSGFFSEDTDIYNQRSTNSYVYYGVDAEGKQMLLPFDQPELDAVHDKYKGTGKLYKAPNGKKSNLSHKDWLLVRTTAFKAWFGDWENDPRGRDVSKAIDENGEPLPLYHNLDGSGYSSFTTEKHAGAVPTFLKVLNPYTIYTENPFGDSVEIFTPKARVSVSIEKLVKGVKNGSIGVFRNFDGVMLSNADKGEFCVIMFSKFKPAKTKTYAQSSTEKKLEKSIDADIDARYFVAIDTGDTDTARSIIDEQAHRRGYSSDNSHRIAHQPPRASDNYGTNMAEAITSGLVPDDYWTHPERYTSSPEEQEAFYYVRSAIREHEKRIKEGKTGGVITVYRAVPKDVKETKLRNGDWVTPSRDYAVQHGQAMHNGYRIITQSAELENLWWDGNSIAEWGYDDGRDYVYRNTKNSRKLNDTVVTDNDEGHIVPPSKRFNYRAEEEYYQPTQDNPLLERFSPEAEQQFSESFGEKQEGSLERIAKSFSDFLHGFRGDYAELARAISANPQLMFARETLRMMAREADAKTLLAVQDLARALKGLSAHQLNIFSRYMLLNDIRTFWKQNPNAKNLPLGFTPQSLKQEYERFLALVKGDNAVKNALQAEHQLQKRINERLAAFAQELNMPKLAERVKRNSFYILDYARLLNGNGINSNYFEAVADTRTQQLKDITRLNAVLKLRNAYGRKLKAKLVDTFGAEWQKHIPQGYKVFNPLKGSFIHSAKSLTEDLLGAALETAGQQLGLSRDTMKILRSKVSDNSDAHLLLLPEALANTLDKLSVPVVRGHLGAIVKQFTTGWKKMMLFFPTRAIKYNLRNITGDLDAAIAGNPHALAYVPQAISELYRVYYGDGEATPELREFQKRGGAVTIQSTQDLGDYKQLKEAQRLIDELKGKKSSVWTALPRKTWALLDKVAWSGIQNFSNFREQWIRYACYLDYIHQMQSNDEHMPVNWGASVRAEVLSIPAKTIKGIRDRAFKMSNELIGAYDQVSESGKSLRDILIPFYSWMEVNAKRYWQLIKNGITEDGFGDFASRFLKGELANAPYYAFKLAKTYLFVNLIAMLIAAFNHFVWPEDEDKLPPDIQAKPHITLGHDMKGNVLYFDKVGAMMDNLEWFGQEESPFLPFAKDVKDIFDGRQTFTGLAAKFIISPLNKLIAGLTPLIKTPMELIAGQSFYPDFTNPRNINDRWQYLAQSLGLAWPYKGATGQPVDNWMEFKSLFMYSADADEAAYFYTLGLVRKFQEDVLGKRIGGFAVTQRGQALRRLKAALRLEDDDAVKSSLEEYYSLGGNQQGLKASMRNMNPLHGLNKNEQERFLKWLSSEDRKYFDRADKFFHRIADMYLNQPTQKKSAQKKQVQTKPKQTQKQTQKILQPFLKQLYAR